ncbi:MAG: hypothetical protein AAFQ22_07780 [Pseudomonadota bacterium]
MADLFNYRAWSVRGKRASHPERETWQLKSQAEAVYARTALDETQRAAIALAKVDEMSAAFSAELPTELEITLAMAVDDLFDEACVYLPEIDLAQIDVMGEEGRWLRALYTELIRFHSAPEKSLTLLGQILNASFSHVIGRLSLAAPLKAMADGKLDSKDRLHINLLDYLGEPKAAMDGVIRAVFCQEAKFQGMFTQMRKRLEINIDAASGGTHRAGFTAPILLPSENAGLDAKEAAEAYFRGTPFADVFDAKLPLVLPDKARFEHAHIIAGSGHGKTQLLSHLILGDLHRAQTHPQSVVVMDSQGDLISQIENLSLIQHTDLADRLVILDPTEFHHPIALNPFSLDESRLADLSPADRERTVFGAVDLFEHFFSELLGSELTAQQGTVFKFLIRLLIEIPGATLITLRDLMDDPKPFVPHMKRLSGSARAFFEREFLSGSYDQSRRQIARRLWAVLANPVFERIFSSPVNKVDWFDMMQTGKIILVNTSKDYLKSSGSQLFGQFITAQIAQGVLERAGMPDAKRTPTMIYIDEAHEYMDASIEMLLSQGRKYRAGLTLAHQHLDQLTPSQRSSLMANTSIKLVGGVSRKDAQALSGELGCSADNLGALQKRGSMSEFALSVRHMISAPARLSVPLGVLSRQDQALPEITQKRRSHIRQAFGRKWEPERAIDHRPSTEPLIQHVQNLPGRGSASHRAEQARIKTLAQSLGYSAHVEERLKHGLGSVDVLVANSSTKIGFEISVTTSPEHEVENISKCLSDGFDFVISTASDRTHLKAIETLAWKSIPARDISKVLFLIPDDVEGFLRTHQRAPEKNVVMGYTVTVQTVPTSSDGRRIRREQLQRLLEREKSA